MSPNEPRFPNLSENHRRAISTAMVLLDERLSEFELYARGRECRSVMYRERNRMTAGQKERLLKEIEEARAVLRELKEALGLRAETEEVHRKIWAAASAFWEVLVETQTKHLRRYGKMPPELAEFLDPRVETLIERVQNLSRIAGGG